MGWYIYRVTVTIIATKDDETDNLECVKFAETDEPCIKVTSQYNPACIEVKGDTPNIYIEETKGEESYPPQLAILSIQGDDPILNKNLDENGMIYVKDYDTVIVIVLNHKVGDTYTSIETNTDLFYGAVYDNGDGTFIWSVGENLDGLDRFFRVKRIEPKKSPSVFGYTHCVTMEQSVQVYLKTPKHIERGLNCYTELIPYSSDNEYSFRYYDVEAKSDINETSESVIKLDTNTGRFGLSTTGILQDVYVYVKTTEPLKYPSEESVDLFRCEFTTLPSDLSLVSRCSSSSYFLAIGGGTFIYLTTPIGVEPAEYAVDITASKTSYDCGGDCSSGFITTYLKRTYPYTIGDEETLNKRVIALQKELAFEGVCCTTVYILTSAWDTERYVVRTEDYILEPQTPEDEALGLIRNRKGSCYIDRIEYY